MSTNLPIPYSRDDLIEIFESKELDQLSPILDLIDLMDPKYVVTLDTISKPDLVMKSVIDSKLKVSTKSSMKVSFSNGDVLDCLKFSGVSEDYILVRFLICGMDIYQIIGKEENLDQLILMALTTYTGVTESGPEFDQLVDYLVTEEFLPFQESLEYMETMDRIGLLRILELDGIKVHPVTSKFINESSANVISSHGYNYAVMISQDHISSKFNYEDFLQTTKVDSIPNSNLRIIHLSEGIFNIGLVEEIHNPNKKAYVFSNTCVGLAKLAESSINPIMEYHYAYIIRKYIIK